MHFFYQSHVKDSHRPASWHQILHMEATDAITLICIDTELIITVLIYYSGSYCSWVPSRMETIIQSGWRRTGNYSQQRLRMLRNMSMGKVAENCYQIVIQCWSLFLNDSDWFRKKIILIQPSVTTRQKTQLYDLTSVKSTTFKWSARTQVNTCWYSWHIWNIPQSCDALFNKQINLLKLNVF